LRESYKAVMVMPVDVGIGANGATGLMR